MINFDKSWLADRGLENLDPEVEVDLLRYVYEALEIRVGERIAEGMTDEQLREFDDAMDEGDGPALEWLRTNAPDSGKIAEDVLEELGEELRGRATEFLARFGR